MFLFKRSGIYYIQYLDEQENRIRRVSTKARNRSTALNFLADLKVNLRDKQKPKFITLANFQKEYEAFIKKTYSLQYARSVRLSFNLLMKEVKGNTPLNHITLNQLEKFFIDTFNRTKHGAHLYCRTLKSAFSKAVQWDYIQENPLARFKLPKVAKKNPVFVSVTELRSIICEESKSDMASIYLLAFNTGMRLSEIVNLKWNAIDLTQREIKVMNTEAFTTKGKKERCIPINDTVYNLLKKSLPKIRDIRYEGFVFSKMKGVKYNPDYVSKNFKRAFRKAKLSEEVHFHTLRHSFASNLVTRGVSLYVVKELLGHDDYSTTQVYAHLQREALSKAVVLLD